MKTSTQLLDVDFIAIITCLRNNADVFAFSSADLTLVDTNIVMHSLNVDPAARPIKQKLRQFDPKNDKVI